MSPQRIAGIALFVIGVVLLVIGMNASDSVADRWSNFFTGHFTDTTMWYIVGGIAMIIIGLPLAAWGGRKSIT